jgi:Winged helix DNA-binding domain
MPSADARHGAFAAHTLVRVRAMRGAPVVIRVFDYDIFTAGVVPTEEVRMRAFIGNAAQNVRAAKLTALEAVQLVTEHARRALAEGPLDRDAFHAELRHTLLKALLPYCRVCDSHHAHPSLVSAVARAGRLVIFSRDKGPYELALFDSWYGSKKRALNVSSEGARSQLRKRFLQAYAPASVSDYAAWPASRLRKRARCGIGSRLSSCLFARKTVCRVQCTRSRKTSSSCARPSASDRTVCG